MAIVNAPRNRTLGNGLSRYGGNLRSIAKSVYSYSNPITPTLQVIRHIELSRIPAAFTVSNSLSIDPKVERAIDTLESHSKLHVHFLFLRNLKFALVGPSLIHLGRNIRRIHGKRIHDICIMRRSIALELPHAGYRDILPFIMMSVSGIEFLCAIRDLGGLEWVL